VLLLFPSSLVFSQSISISGRVIDSSSEQPIRDAHVFIASSLVGTSTDNEGHFLLHDIPSGAHRIVVTMLGYESTSMDTLLRVDNTYELDVQLNFTAVELEEVVVNARLARKWQRRLRKFTRLFLGETQNSTLTSNSH